MKRPVVLLIVLAALVAFAMIYDKGLSKRVNSASLVGAKMREYLFPDLLADNVRGINVREGDKTVHISLKDGKWQIAERSNYAASIDKVKRVVSYLSELKIKGKEEVKDSLLGEVKLLPPGEAAADRTGLLVDLLNEKGEVFASVIAGERTSTSGGASASSGNMFGGPGESRFARIPKGNDGNTVWFVEDSFYEVSTEPKEWVDKAFIDVQKVMSAEISLPNASDSWKAVRKDPDAAFVFANAPAGEDLDTAKADGLSNVLASAYFNDVLPKDKVTPDFMKGASKAKLVTAHGFTYDIEIVEKKDTEAKAGSTPPEPKYYMTVKVSADLPKERKAAADEKPEDKKAKDEQFAKDNKALEEKLAKEKAFEGWVYDVSNYTIGILLKKRSEITRDKTPPAPPAGGSGIPGVPSIPGMLPAPAPGGAGAMTPPPAPPISVTTPPVSVESAKPTPPPAPPAPAPAPEAKPEAPAPAPEAKPEAPAPPAEAKPSEAK